MLGCPLADGATLARRAPRALGWVSSLHLACVCLAFHPERLQTIEDLVTWGRLKERPVVPDDWSI